MSTSGAWNLRPFIPPGKPWELHCVKTRCPLVRRSLAALEERLDPHVFFRASRRAIVNLGWIERLDDGVGGGLVATLRGGRTVDVSRRQAARLRERMSP